VAVLTSLANGSIHALTETSPTGQVDLRVPDDASVSVLTTEYTIPGEDSTMERHIRTHAKIRTHTHFAVRLPESLEGDAIGPVSFVPDATLPNHAVKVRITTPCSQRRESPSKPTDPIEFDTLRVCKGAKEYYAIALALDSEGNAIESSVLDHLPVTAGPQKHTVSFAYSSSQPLNRREFVNFEPEISSIRPEISQAKLGIRSFPANASNAYGEVGALEVSTLVQGPSNGPLVATFPVVRHFFDSHVVSAHVVLSEVGGGVSARESGRQLSQEALPESFSFDPYLLAWPDSIAVTHPPKAQRPEVRWSLGDSGEMGNCLAVYARWVEAAELRLVWESTQAAEHVGSMQVPELPPDFVSFMPKANQTLVLARLRNISTDTGCSNLDALPSDYSFSGAWAP
jgi:hypothetical protein